MHIAIMATPDEYQQWLEEQGPNDWDNWRTHPFDHSDIDHDPIAAFLRDIFGLYGYVALGDDGDRSHSFFHQCENEAYDALVLRLPDWMLPLVCRYHSWEPQTISQEKALADFAEAVQAYPALQQLLLVERLEVTPLLQEGA